MQKNVNQHALNRSVAQATGEEVRTIESRGFVPHDPELNGFDDSYPAIDWDALELSRLALFPDRQRRCAMA